MSSVNGKYELSVILPVYNLKDNIEETIFNTKEFLENENQIRCYEIILVEDGSNDGTTAILRRLAAEHNSIKIITHSKNLGYGKAILSGISQASFGLILLMDADGQFKINSVKEMFPHIVEYDIISGYRFDRKDPFYRVIIGQAYTLLVFFLLGIKSKDINSGFKLFKKQVFDLDKINSHAGAFYTDVFLRAIQSGYRIKEVPVDHYPRLLGKQTGASLKVIIEAIIDLIKLKIDSKDKKLSSNPVS